TIRKKRIRGASLRAVNSGTNLRRAGQYADVVVENVVAQPKTAPNRHLAAVSRGVSKAYSRHKILFRRLRRTEVNQARHVRNTVQTLLTPTVGCTGELVSQTKVQTEVTSGLPDVITVPVNSVLIPRVSQVTETALGKTIVLKRIQVPSEIT